MRGMSWYDLDSATREHMINTAQREVVHRINRGQDVVDAEVISERRDTAMNHVDEASDNVILAQNMQNEITRLGTLAMVGAGTGLLIIGAGIALGTVSSSLFYLWVPGLLMFLLFVGLLGSLVANYNPIEQRRSVEMARRDYNRLARRIPGPQALESGSNHVQRGESSA